MNAVLVANWNSVVGPHDIVHVLGDVAMGRREETMPLVGHLAGHKILYPGNHDSWFRPIDEGMWLLHGRVHERWRRQGRMVNVGVDVWDFPPVTEQVIAGLMDGTPGAST